MYSFRNINNYIPREYERVGMLKDKRWFESPNEFNEETGRKERALFKPRRKESGRTIDLFCGNHYGELAGYLLARKIGMESCRAELVDVVTDKNRYTKKSKRFKEGALVYSRLKCCQELTSGNVIIERFKLKNPEAYARLSLNSSRCLETNTNNNNIEVILASIEHVMREEGISEERIQEAKDYMIQMAIYDCAFGNNDRHDENWSMSQTIKDMSTLRMYPAYDNERVLGLYENSELIKNAVDNDKVAEVSKSVLFSRMGIPGRPESISYDVLLNYLAEHYPEQTQKYIKTILDNVTSKDIAEMLSQFDKLPPEYIEFGTLTYADRRKTLEQIYERLNSRQSLPDSSGKTTTDEEIAL